ncbi:MAG TPA: hypothetical protein VFJ58_16840 [Armatimonadota bacterium]|nr:hypothetical protein [Armatimonadota bacterium]
MKMICLLLAFSLMSMAGARAADPVVEIHTGKHWIWYAPKDLFQQHEKDIESYYSYADNAFSYLTGAWGLVPPRKQYFLFVNPQTGGGFAAGDIQQIHAVTGKDAPGIGVAYDAFFNVANGIKGYWGYVLTTHEMVNLLTGQIVSGGWPVDWWADHVSPFPLMTAVQVEFALKPEVAIYHARQLDTPLTRMFVRLKDEFGWSLFRKAFVQAINDGVQWDLLGANPSALRTNYVAAYLQMHAPADLARYLSGVVPGYDPATVSLIIRAHERWEALPRSDPQRKELQDAFLHGDYNRVLAQP